MGAASGSAPFARHGAAVSPVTFSPDGSILATVTVSDCGMGPIVRTRVCSEARSAARMLARGG
jgi:hypothetical protein